MRTAHEDVDGRDTGHDDGGHASSTSVSRPADIIAEVMDEWKISGLAVAVVQEREGGIHQTYSWWWNGAREGMHVLESTQIRSLGAVRLPAAGLTLFEDSYQGKRSLRASGLGNQRSAV